MENCILKARKRKKPVRPAPVKRSMKTRPRPKARVAKTASKNTLKRRTGKPTVKKSNGVARSRRLVDSKPKLKTRLKSRPKSVAKPVAKMLSKRPVKRSSKVVKPVVLSKRERASRQVEHQTRVRIAELVSRSKRPLTHEQIAKKLHVSKALVHKVIRRPKVVRKIAKPARAKVKAKGPALEKPMSRQGEEARAVVIRGRAAGQLEKWKGGARQLNSHLSTGRSIRFSFRKRLTNAAVARVMDRVHSITMRLDSGIPFHEWMTVFSVLVVGKRHPRLPGYQPLAVAGLAPGEQAYVTYESTGKFRTEEDMRARLASMLYSYVTVETFVSLEQVSVSTLRSKSAEERVEWFDIHRSGRGEGRRKSKRRDRR